MDEMKVWETLNSEHQERVTEEAQRLLLWCITWAKEVREWGLLIDGSVVRGAVEEDNQHLVERLDSTVMRSLSGLKQAGIPRPLIPLYVAIWKLAMEIEAGEIQRQHELAVVFAMVRVQSTARLVNRHNTSPGNKATGAELKRRGLIGR